MIPRLVGSCSLLDQPFLCGGEVVGSDLPDMSGERRPLPLVVVELLDRLDLPCLFVSEGLHRGVEGGSIGLGFPL